MSNSSDPDQTRLFVRPDLCPNCLQRVSKDDKNRPYQDKFIANRAHERSREHSKLSHMKCASMFFCHQVSVHNNCHLNWRKLADLSHQHLYSDECLNVSLPVSDKICYPPSTICLDDFDKSKPEIRPASNVTMVVSSIYCDKIVHTKMHLLSST